MRKADTSGSPKFFLGTDTAPHPQHKKESACGCAGIFNAPHALESYLKVFDEENALAHFEAFASLNGPAFYGLAPNKGKIVLKRESVLVPESLELTLAGSDIIPFHAGANLSWKFCGDVS